MNKYKVYISPKAYRDLDNIYMYIKENLFAPDTALNLISLIEEKILSLETFPNVGPIRKVGIYANKGYRQLFIKNYTLIYRVDETANKVVIITIRFSPSNF